jgi:hypothetical protein
VEQQLRGTSAFSPLISYLGRTASRHKRGGAPGRGEQAESLERAPSRDADLIQAINLHTLDSFKRTPGPLTYTEADANKKTQMKLICAILLSLLPLGAIFAADELPPVFLNHFFVALDQTSLDALRKSPQIQALAHTVERHTVAGKDEWTGFYVQGRQTYMEFFGAENLPEGTRVGDTGLGLSVERLGGVTAIAARLRTVFGNRIEINAVPRTTPTGSIPWFTSTEINIDEPQAMQTWFMENDPNYLATVHPGAKIGNPFSREQSLSWNFLPDHQLDDITGVTAALNPADTAQLATELKLIGWSVRTQGKGFIATGPDLKLVILPARTRAGIQQVDLRLRQSVPKQNIPLGNIELFLEGEAGRLVFWK